MFNHIMLASISVAELEMASAVMPLSKFKVRELDQCLKLLHRIRYVGSDYTLHVVALRS